MLFAENLDCQGNIQQTTNHRVAHLRSSGQAHHCLDPSCWTWPHCLKSVSFQLCRCTAQHTEHTHHPHVLFWSHRIGRRILCLSQRRNWMKVCTTDSGLWAGKPSQGPTSVRTLCRQIHVCSPARFYWIVDFQSGTCAVLSTTRHNHKIHQTADRLSLG